MKTKGITGLYSGCTALIVGTSLLHKKMRYLLRLPLGNSVKAGVRFVSYEHFKHMLADPEVSSGFHLFFVGLHQLDLGQSWLWEEPTRYAYFLRGDVRVVISHLQPA